MLAAPLPERLAALRPRLRDTVERLLVSAPAVTPEREAMVRGFAEALTDEGSNARLVFVCTHNSRRSHVAMVWAGLAAYLYGWDGVRVYSGGTEVTAFNTRAVAALRRVGFACERGGGQNAVVTVRTGDGADRRVCQGHATPPTVYCSSKRYDDATNPQTDFVAVMTCADADANCPYIPGARRVPLRYEDPGRADGTAGEAAAYAGLVDVAGRELLWGFGAGRDTDGRITG